MEKHDPVKGITAGQIGKIYDVLVAALQKSNLPSKETQQVLEIQGGALADEFVVMLRKRVDAISDMIIRHVTVNRSRTPEQALDATKRTTYLNASVVATMPQGSGDEVEVFFFKLGRYVSDADLDKEYELRGLKPADPYTLAAVNDADPAFADDHPNGTHWKDENGSWYYAAFHSWHDERHVDVLHNDYGWDDGWWFAGCRK